MNRLTCGRVRSLLAGSRARSVAPETGVLLAAHLLRCARCHAETAEAQWVQTILGGIDMSPSLKRQLLESVRTHTSSELRVLATETRIGWYGIAYNDRGIVLTEWPQASANESYRRLRGEIGDFIAQEAPRDDVGHRAARMLADYHSGRRVEFDVPLDFSLVSPFSRRVLLVTAKIPYGEVRTYAWVARAAGNPKAARATGRALGANPFSPIVPCHRVLAADHSLHGYGKGLPLKERLLRMEGYLK